MANQEIQSRKVDKQMIIKQSMEEILKPEMPKAESKDLDVLKELFEPKDIKMKTELTAVQVNLLNQKSAISRILDWPELNECLVDFMTLNVSLNRKGRAEFVDGFKANREQAVPNQGILSRMGNWINKP
jgi:hypothetical protein